MSLLDPDSNTAYRFTRDRIAQELFVRNAGEWSGKDAENIANACFDNAEIFMQVKADRTRPNQGNGSD